MSKTLIIAEAGVNHNGDINIAKQLIDAAVAAGVDYVKFQTFKTESLVSKSAKKAEYQIENTGTAEESQFDMIKKLELDVETHHILIDYCAEKGIKFLSTAFDLDSVDLLSSLNIDFFKIPSGEITNLPYLVKIAKQGKPVIISTGMCTMEEVKMAYDVFISNGVPHDDITILHCNTEYPTPMSDVNLTAMLSIKKELSVPIGYSDHTLGIEVPIAAVALGAVCIEKHFTLDRAMDGPDHRASLEPSELKAMVDGIRNIEIALGDGVKKPSISEQKNITIARKSIHVCRDMKAGHILKASDLKMMRPGSGISPMDMDMVIGKKLTRNMVQDDILNLDYLK